MTNNPDNDAGKAHFKARRFAEAIECFTRAHASLPNDALVLGNRSAAYSSLGQHSNALADAQAAVALDYAYVKGYYRQATALLALDRAAEAAQAASAGLNLEPRNGQMAALKDQAMARLAAQRAEESEGSGEGSDDDDDEAEEAEQQQQDVRMSAEEEAEQRKARAEARKAAGNGHFKEKRYREAASEYSRAMEIDPANATYPLNRSAALLQLNDGKQALADAQAALELSPGLVKAHVRASKALCLLGRFSDARRRAGPRGRRKGARAQSPHSRPCGGVGSSRRPPAWKAPRRRSRPSSSSSSGSSLCCATAAPRWSAPTLRRARAALCLPPLSSLPPFSSPAVSLLPAASLLSVALSPLAAALHRRSPPASSLTAAPRPARARRLARRR